MPEQPRAPNQLREATHVVDGDPGVRLLSDWVWYPKSRTWALLLCLTPQKATHRLVPEQTLWYVLVEEGYPLGGIHLNPAKEGGLQRTFPHQSYNGSGNANVPWRTGSPCLHVANFTIEQLVASREPTDAAQRLRWHVKRALAWLIAAEEEILVLPNEAFELPATPLAPGEKRCVVFSETEESWEAWQRCPLNGGYVTFAHPIANPTLLVTRAFFSTGRKEAVRHQWGKWVEEKDSAEECGIWFRLPGIPVLSPWHLPSTWGELREALTTLGIQLDDVLRDLLPAVRHQRSCILLVGFPIPEKANGTGKARMHWLASVLDGFANGKSPGFRPIKASQWMRDRQILFRDGRPITWLDTQDWSPERLSSRGQLPEALRLKSWLLIGAGALGSAIAELLVRGGVNNLALSDSDVFAGGNLVRHTLDVSAVGRPKVHALRQQLNRAAPHAKVISLGSFPPSQTKDLELVSTIDLIVDCTGSDAVLRELAAFPWTKPKRFISLSIGLRAQRLFCFVADGTAFPIDDFRSQIQPFLAQERSIATPEDFPREGIGCWNPVFPARSDDIWLLAAAAIKELGPIVPQPGPLTPNLHVIAQGEHDALLVKERTN